MKPKTQFEKDIVRYANTLAPINDGHRRQAYDKCFAKEIWYAGRDFNGFCTNCGQEGITLADPKVKKAVCPHCGKTLPLVRTRKTKDKCCRYFGIFTTVHGYQVVRYLKVDRQIYRFDPEPIHYSCIEVSRFWMAPDGTHRYEARKLGSLFYNQYWKYDTPIELRQQRDCNFFVQGIYAPQRVLPHLKRNGYRGNLHGEPPADAFVMLTKEPKYETLWKAGYWKLLNKTYDLNQILLNWDSLKICMRNNYRPKDVSLWYDMMHNVRELGKDVRSPHYVCPRNLKAMHDSLMRQVEAKWRKEEEERQRQRIRECEATYLKTHGCFFGISFSAKDIEVTVLQSVQEFYEEGKAMHNCVYTNDYYKKKGSVILSVKDSKGKRLATIEFSLSRGKVVQCRAACNEVPKRKEEIVNLIMQHKNEIIMAKKKAA